MSELRHLLKQVPPMTPERAVICREVLTGERAPAFAQAANAAIIAIAEAKRAFDEVVMAFERLDPESRAAVAPLLKALAEVSDSERVH